jgi:hypothetical protein
MKIFLDVRGKSVEIRIRDEGPDHLGDFVEEVRPGGSAFGLAYEKLIELGDGEHEVEEEEEGEG